MIRKSGPIVAATLLFACAAPSVARETKAQASGPQRLAAASGVGVAITTCPQGAVFLALEDQIRGYPSAANGPTPPCQVLAGPHTGLSTARSLAISIHGYLHVVQFLTNGTYEVFRSTASGDQAPTRTISTETNDLTAIAVDSDLHDYILGVRGQPSVFIYPDGVSGQQPNPALITDPNIVAPAAIAVDADENLLIGGYDANGQPRIDTFDTGRALGSGARLIRSLAGPHTGLLPGSSNVFNSSTMSFAVDQATGELFVFNAAGLGANVLDQVSVFPARVSGDAPPTRVLNGSSTGIAGTGILGTNKIAVANDGRLFVSEPNETILVFAAGAAGNVPPAQRIVDSTLGTGSRDEGGIAAR